MVHYSNMSLSRQFIIVTWHCPGGSLFRHVIVPIFHYSDMSLPTVHYCTMSLSRLFIIPTCDCPNSSVFRHVIVPTVHYFDMSLSRQFIIPTFPRVSYIGTLGTDEGSQGSKPQSSVRPVWWIGVPSLIFSWGGRGGSQVAIRKAVVVFLRSLHWDVFSRIPILWLHDKVVRHRTSRGTSRQSFTTAHMHLFHSKNICPLLFLTSRQTSALYPFPTSSQFVWGRPGIYI